MVSVSTTTAHFAAVVRSVTDETGKLPSMKKMSSKNRKLFAIDLSLVAFAIRTGYLVDTVAPQDAIDVFSRLLSALRAIQPIFETITHVYEPTSDQSFFVNVPILLGRDISRGIYPTAILERWDQKDRGHKGNTFSFVGLYPDQRYDLLTAPPLGIITVLKSLVDSLVNITSLPVSKTLLDNISPDTSVPIAAVLVEYPVAYVPSPTNQASFLSDVPLDVYECVLIFDETLQLWNPHTLLKFSCPSTLGKEHPDLLGPLHIIECLTAKFQPRLHKISPNIEFGVRHSIEIVERVAL